MRAIVQDRYGPPLEVLRLTDVDVPPVGDTDVLVRVHASSANPWDWHFIRGEPVLMRPAGIGGIRKPRFRIPGGDVAGVVERAGDGASGFAPGDEVYGFGHGAFAEFVAVPQGNLAAKPPSLTFEQAAAVPLGAVTALQGLRAGKLEAGQRVLVVGASGGVGTFAVQIANQLGAHVSGVCSTANVELVRSLGVDHVIDYRVQDFTTGETTYDLVFQLGGTYSPKSIRKVLAPRGTLIQSFGDGSRWLGPLGNIVSALALNPFVGQRLTSFTANETTETLDEITGLIESGSLRPVIDCIVDLADAATAIDLVERGSPAGKVVVRVVG